MPRGPRVLSSTDLYHVTIRAANRQQIFETASDYRIFLSSMRTISERPFFWIHAYCLMGNHIHLLVEAEGKVLSDTMKALADSFVYRYNHEHERSGVLFQGRFHSVPIEDQGQFLTVLRYIHQNPMRAGLEAEPGNYPWSSFHSYFHPSKRDFLCRERVLAFFPEEHELQEFLRTPVKMCQSIPICGVVRLNDESTIRLLCEIAEVDGLVSLQALSRKAKHQLIPKLKNYPVTKAGISRILGVSEGTIRRLMKENDGFVPVPEPAK